MTVFGVNTEPVSIPGHRTLYGGPLGPVRIFFGPGARFGWARAPLNKVGPGEYPVISFKTYNDGDMRALVADAPMPFAVCYDHEFEKGITAGSQTIANLAATYVKMRNIVDYSPGPYPVRIVPILNWYQRTQRGFDWSRLGPVFAHADVVGVDSYALAFDALNHDAYTAPADLFGPGADLAHAFDLPFAVPEFGMTIASDGDGDRFAAQMVDYISYAASVGAQWVSYWCNANDNYHLETPPGREAALQVWKTAVRATAPPVTPATFGIGIGE